MRRSTGIASAALLVALTACMGDATAPSQIVRSFSAKVDGAAWTPIFASARATSDGTFTIVAGTSLSTTPLSSSMELTIYNLAVPGTYPLGVDASLTGGRVIFAYNQGTWNTPRDGSAGTITLTDVTTTHIAGAFQYRAKRLFDTVSTTVTEGQFDIPLIAPSTIFISDLHGGSMTGTLGGAVWSAAAVAVVSKPATGALDFNFDNATHNIRFVISGVTGAGTYAFNTDVNRYVSVTQPLGPSWGGTPARSAGTLVITSLTSARMKGTYSATLQSATSAPLVISGTFDVGLQQ